MKIRFTVDQENLNDLIRNKHPESSKLADALEPVVRSLTAKIQESQRAHGDDYGASQTTGKVIRESRTAIVGIIANNAENASKVEEKRQTLQRAAESYRE